MWILPAQLTVKVVLLVSISIGNTVLDGFCLSMVLVKTGVRIGALASKTMLAWF